MKVHDVEDDANGDTDDDNDYDGDGNDDDVDEGDGNGDYDDDGDNNVEVDHNLIPIVLTSHHSMRKYQGFGIWSLEIKIS